MADMTLRMGTWNCQAAGGHYIEVPSAGPEGMAYLYINTVGTITWANSPPAIEDTAMAPAPTPAPPPAPKKAAKEKNETVEGDDA